MKVLEIFTLILSILFTPLASLLGPSAALTAKNTDTAVEEQVDTEVEEVVTTEQDTESNQSRVRSPITVDLEGYCTYEIPLTHFSESSSSSTTRKVYTYKDDKSKITIGYTTGIEEDTDVAGYITQEIADVDIATNLQEDVEINGKTFTTVKAPELISGKQTTVYYTLKGSSAFWARADVVPESDDDEFAEAVEFILKSIYIYYLESGTVFDTPDTGIYEGISEEEKQGNQERYEETSVYNTVFGDRGGYVTGADIPTSWDCMQMIVDGHKLKVPCTMQDLYDAGFEVNTYTWEYGHGEDVKVALGATLDLYVINENGTNLYITVENQSKKDQRSIDDCSVVAIKVDKDKFTDKASEQVGVVKSDVTTDSKLLKGFTLEEIANIGNQTYKRLSEDEKAYVDEVKRKIEEGRYKYPDAIYGSGKATEEWTDEELERINKGLSPYDTTHDNEDSDEDADTSEDTSTEQTEENGSTDETSETSEGSSEGSSEDTKSKDESTDTEDTSDSKESDATDEENTDEESKDSEDTEKEDTSDENSEDVENNDSEESTEESAEDDIPATLILPGGITWTVYTDDLISFYGTGCTRTIVNKECIIVYTSGNKKMEIHMGIVGNINSVTMSVLGE